MKGTIIQDILKIPQDQPDKKDFAKRNGDIYIVNRDKLMTASSNDSLNFFSEKTVDTIEVQKVLATKMEFSGMCENYMDVQVLCTALFVPETNWVILSEKGVKGAFLPLTRIK